MDTANLVVLRTFSTRQDAELAHSALEAADIDSMIAADDAGGTQTGLWMGEGVKLVIRAEDLAHAREVLPDES
jgi:hypothetical protein